MIPGMRRNPASKVRPDRIQIGAICVSQSVAHHQPQHLAGAQRLRVWLNQWLCRIGYPTSGDDVCARSLAAWWLACQA
jgi:hypothetical protein